MDNKMLLVGGGILLVILLGVGGLLVMNNKNADTNVDKKMMVESTIVPTNNNETMMDETSGTESAGMETSENVKAVEITVEGSEFKFSPSDVKVKQGDLVRLTFVNTGKMPHDWVVEGIDDLKTSQVQPGEEETIEFVAEKKGTFVTYCSVGNHRSRGQVGKLIVE